MASSLSSTYLFGSPSRYIQGEGALAQLPSLAAQYGTIPAILYPPELPQYIESFKSIFGDDTFLIPFQGECCWDEINRVINLLSDREVHFIIAFGGGKVIDTVKVVADKMGKPTFVVPSIASSDAPCSAGAVVYTAEGQYLEVYATKSPTCVLMDSRVIADAPVRFFAAGIGDGLSTWFEARACLRAEAPNVLGGRSTHTAQALASLCYTLLKTHGPQATRDVAEHRVTPAVEAVIEANTLLSGLGFESGGLAAAHSIHNGLTAVPQTHRFLHGEKVGFSTVAMLCIEGETEQAREVAEICQACGLPVSLEGIGLRADDTASIRKVAESVDRVLMDHMPGTVTDDAVYDALLRADAIGRALPCLPKKRVA